MLTSGDRYGCIDFDTPELGAEGFRGFCRVMFRTTQCGTAGCLLLPRRAIRELLFKHVTEAAGASDDTPYRRAGGCLATASRSGRGIGGAVFLSAGGGEKKGGPLTSQRGGRPAGRPGR